MKKETVSTMNLIGKKTAFYSSLFGTIIFVTHLISHTQLVIVAGLIFVFAAVIINTILLIANLIELVLNQSLWKHSFATIICILLNIPLSIFYLHFVNI